MAEIEDNIIPIISQKDSYRFPDYQPKYDIHYCDIADFYKVRRYVFHVLSYCILPCT